MKPYFSIVVAAYNAGESIKTTINSILSQTFSDYEIIVKDGMSSDDTLSYVPSSEKITVYSTKDGGIYEGMNEGISYTSGKYLCFLNCGDYFASENVLQKIYDASRELTDTENIVYGNYTRKEVLFKAESKITKFSLYRKPLCHQTMFFGKGVFDKLGVYNTEYRICADYNHTVHAFFDGIAFVYCNCTVCDYLGGGVSESSEHAERRIEEIKKIRKSYYSKARIAWYNFLIFLTFKGLRQKLISDKSPKWVRNLYRKLVNKVNK